jgi:hypothetical protein
LYFFEMPAEQPKRWQQAFHDREVPEGIVDFFRTQQVTNIQTHDIS